MKALVMDEVDEMVARGFKELLHRICGFLPGGVQKVVLGSGMDEECKEVVGRLLADPVEVRVVEVKGRSVEEGRHFFVDCEREEWKLECLVDLLGFLEDKKVIVFCNTRRRVGWLENELVLRNLLVLSVHGDMDVSQRDIVLKRFKKGSGEKSCLICTDLLSGGIPGSDKDVIIHYDISRNCESYARRVCRGSQGNFISVVLIAQEQQQLRDIETYYNIKCEELPSNMDL
uniref:Helicase C-terminal domain-containing protein n=1 Tax=Arcella intermedia TaxID=1963864 RepID=A0A6B2LGW8_9EUKA